MKKNKKEPILPLGHKIVLTIFVVFLIGFIAFFTYLGTLYSEQDKYDSMTDAEAIEYMLSLDEEGQLYFLNHIRRDDAKDLQKKMKAYYIIMAEEEDKFEE